MSIGQALGRWSSPTIENAAEKVVGSEREDAIGQAASLLENHNVRVIVIFALGYIAVLAAFIGQVSGLIGPDKKENPKEQSND